MIGCRFFFFNDTATTEIYTLSLHDALPIWCSPPSQRGSVSNWRGASGVGSSCCGRGSSFWPRWKTSATNSRRRSEEHTSELQSRQYLVCRLLLEKKKNNKIKLYKL